MDKLMHHGIKGQKWGVRRFQDKNGRLTKAGRQRYGADEVIAARGQVIGTVNTSSKTNLDRPVYAFNNKADEDIYTGPYTEYLIGLGHDYVNEHFLKVKKTLVSPNETMRKEIFVDAFRNDEDTFKRELSLQHRFMVEDISSGALSPSPHLKSILNSYDERKTSNPTDEYIKNTLYPLFNTIHDGSNSRARELYLNNVRKLGYTALTDDNNRLVYNNAVQPFMVLYGNKTLKELDAKGLDYDAITDATSKVRKRNKAISGSDTVIR